MNPPLELEVFMAWDVLLRENGFLNEEKYICRYRESIRWPSGPAGLWNSTLVNNAREFLGRYSEVIPCWIMFEIKFQILYHNFRLNKYKRIKNFAFS